MTSESAITKKEYLYCNISGKPLVAPVMMCGLGRLYNKRCLAKALKDLDLLPLGAKHLKYADDVKQLTPTIKVKHKQYLRKLPYVCPFSGYELGADGKFIGLWSCGCVYHELAIKRITDNRCMNCSRSFATLDIIIINATGTDLMLNYSNMKTRESILDGLLAFKLEPQPTFRPPPKVESLATGSKRQREGEEQKSMRKRLRELKKKYNRPHWRYSILDDNTYLIEIHSD